MFNKHVLIINLETGEVVLEDYLATKDDIADRIDLGEFPYDLYIEGVKVDINSLDYMLEVQY